MKNKTDFIKEKFFVKGERRERVKIFTLKGEYFYADWKGNLFPLPKNDEKLILALIFPECYYRGK